MKRLNVRWSTAMNGKIAVDKWRQGGFHLVLMDIQLPVMNGLDATKEIRRLERANKIGVYENNASEYGCKSPEKLFHGAYAEDETNGGDGVVQDDLNNLSLFKSSVIIVALTASSLQSDRHEALAAGCNDFLTKVSLQILTAFTSLKLSSLSTSTGCLEKSWNGDVCKHSLTSMVGGNGKSCHQHLRSQGKRTSGCCQMDLLPSRIRKARRWMPSRRLLSASWTGTRVLAETARARRRMEHGARRTSQPEVTLEVLFRAQNGQALLIPGTREDAHYSI